MTAAVLDPCCGSRMMWFDRQDSRAVFADRRSETLTVTDNSRGNSSGQRVLRIEPDFLMDFRAMPYPDGAFKLVAFDPPHLVQAGPRGAAWAINYGYCRTSLDYHPPGNPQGSNDPRCPAGCQHKAPEYVALQFAVIFAKPGEHGGAKNAAAYACQHHADRLRY